MIEVRTAAASAEWGRDSGVGGIFQVAERSCIWIGVVVTQIYTTVKANQNVHLESVHFIVCKLYLDFQ